MERKIVSVTLLVTSVVMLMMLGTPQKVRAKSGCSNTSLRGSYGVRGTGAAVSGPFEGPIAFVGVVTFDGNGQLAGELSQRLNTATGPTTLVKVPIVGTYTVNSDCTGEETWRNPVTGNFNTHELVLVENGRKFLFVVTTFGAPPIVSGEGIKQFPGESGQD